MDQGFDKFSECLSENYDYFIPIGIFLVSSMLTNVYLCCKLSCSKLQSPLEENIELVRLTPKDDNSSILDTIEMGNAKT